MTALRRCQLGSIGAVSEGEVKALVGPTVLVAPKTDFVLYALVRNARDPLWQDQRVITLEIRQSERRAKFQKL